MYYSQQEIDPGHLSVSARTEIGKNKQMREQGVRKVRGSPAAAAAAACAACGAAILSSRRLTARLQAARR